MIALCCSDAVASFYPFSLAYSGRVHLTLAITFLYFQYLCMRTHRYAYSYTHRHTHIDTYTYTHIYTYTQHIYIYIYAFTYLIICDLMKMGFTKFTDPHFFFFYNFIFLKVKILADRISWPFLSPLSTI